MQEAIGQDLRRGMWKVPLRETETVLMSRIRAAVSQLGYVRVFRNNVGMMAGLRYGLATGSADLIGLVSPHGRFLSLEVKTATGRESKDQVYWGEMIEDFGGVHEVVRTIPEAIAACERARRPA